MPEDKDDKPKQKRTPARPPAGDVFDVRRPGRALASPTSRPVIVGHKPEAQAAQVSVSGIGEASPAPARRKIQINPTGDIQAVAVSPPEKDDAGAEPKDKGVSEEDKDALGVAAIDGASGPPDLPEQKLEPEPEKPYLTKEMQESESADKPSGEDENRSMVFTKPKLVIEPPKEAEEPTDKPVEEAKEEADLESEEKPEEAASTDEADKKPESAEAEQTAPTTDESAPATEAEGMQQAQQEEQKPEPHIDPLFDDHGVIISRNKHVSHHGSGAKTFLLLLLILALAAVALDILLDLEILDLPGIPHTDYL